MLKLHLPDEHVVSENKTEASSLNSVEASELYHNCINELATSIETDTVNLTQLSYLNEALELVGQSNESTSLLYTLFSNEDVETLIHKRDQVIAHKSTLEDIDIPVIPDDEDAEPREVEDFTTSPDDVTETLPEDGDQAGVIHPLSNESALALESGTPSAKELSDRLKTDRKNNAFRNAKDASFKNGVDPSKVGSSRVIENPNYRKMNYGSVGSFRSSLYKKLRLDKIDNPKFKKVSSKVIVIAAALYATSKIVSKIHESMKTNKAVYNASTIIDAFKAKSSEEQSSILDNKVTCLTHTAYLGALKDLDTLISVFTKVTPKDPTKLFEYDFEKQFSGLSMSKLILEQAHGVGHILKWFKLKSYDRSTQKEALSRLGWDVNSIQKLTSESKHVGDALDQLFIIFDPKDLEQAYTQYITSIHNEYDKKSSDGEYDTNLDKEYDSKLELASNNVAIIKRAVMIASKLARSLYSTQGTILNTISK